MKYVKEKKRTFFSTFKGVIHSINHLIKNKKKSKIFIPELGLNYHVPSSTIFSRNLYKYGSWEAKETNWIIKNFYNLESANFVDVGANFGWYTCIFSQLARLNGKVIAIEPSPDNLYYLENNIQENKFKNVLLEKVAVGEKEENLLLYKALNSNPGAHSLIKDTPFQSKEGITYPVKVKPLDSILFNVNKINLMKMDIEGYEISALKGGLDTLKKVENLLIEFSPHLWTNPLDEATEFFKILFDSGLEPYTLEKNCLKRFDKADIDELFERLIKIDRNDFSISSFQRDFIFSRT